jgi:hypothetical protein
MMTRNPATFKGRPVHRAARPSARLTPSLACAEATIGAVERL